MSIIVRCGSLCGLALPGVHWLQEPYKSMKHIDDFYLFNLADDYHELHDLKASEPQQLATMQQQLTDFLASIQNSQVNETQCAKK